MSLIHELPDGRCLDDPLQCKDGRANDFVTGIFLPDSGGETFHKHLTETRPVPTGIDEPDQFKSSLLNGSIGRVDLHGRHAQHQAIGFSEKSLDTGVGPSESFPHRHGSLGHTR